ncbi:MAG: hypothetical protein Q9208_004512 [Pyrenodesmia sp. 3 TL-2023]
MTMEELWLAWYDYSGSLFWATTFATVAIHEVVSLVRHALRLALKSGPLLNVEPQASVSHPPIRYKGDAVTRVLLLADQVVELGLLATFPPKTPFFDLVVLSPFPSARELLLQVCILLGTEECVRVWAYKTATKWMSKQDASQEGDVASVLAVEYLIAKAVLPFFMVRLGVSRAVDGRVRAIHLVVFVCWIALRQFRVFGRGLDILPDRPSIRGWLSLVDFGTKRDLDTAPLML